MSVASDLIINSLYIGRYKFIRPMLRPRQQKCTSVHRNGTQDYSHKQVSNKRNQIEGVKHEGSSESNQKRGG